MQGNRSYCIINKRAVSFKEEKNKQSSNEFYRKIDNDVINLPMQKSKSVIDLPSQEPPSSDHVCNSDANNQQNAEVSDKLLPGKMCQTSILSFIAHSEPLRLPGSAEKCVTNDLNAMNQRFDFTGRLSSPSTSSPASPSTKSTKIIPTIFSPSPPIVPSRERSTDAIESFDILNEAMKLLRLLIVEISKSFDTIPGSNALPSVIAKYSGWNTASNCDFENVAKQNLNRSFRDNPTHEWKNSFPSSVYEEVMELLDAFQSRCLEYREIIKDYAEEILEECRYFTELKIPQMKTFSDRIVSLRENFSDFKELCRKQLQNVDCLNENFLKAFNIFVQTTFLHALEEQNDDYLSRLQSGMDLFRAHCKFIRFENKASQKINVLLREIDVIRRTTVGCRV